MSKDAKANVVEQVAEPTSPAIRKSIPLINDRNFQLLREAQQGIMDETGMTPNIRMLVNAIITKESIDVAASNLTSKILQMSKQEV